MIKTKEEIVKKNVYVCDICGKEFILNYGDDESFFIESYRLAHIDSDSGQEIVETIELCNSCQNLVHEKIQELKKER